MREGYKQTEIGEIPVDWEVRKLGEVCIFLSRGKSPKYCENSIYKAVNQKSIQGNGIVFDDLRPITHDFWEKLSSNFKLSCGEVLVNSTGTGTLGRTVVFSNIKSCYCMADSHVTIIRTDQQKLNNYFLSYYLCCSAGQKKIYTQCVTGSTNQIELSKSLFEILYIPLPPLPEQKKIAEILSTVDDKIEVTEQQIGQYKELKTGLMQNLLTRGIGHTEFKKTEVGEIPVDWEVRKLGEVCEIVSGGTPSTSVEEFWINGNIYWATPTDITNTFGRCISTTERKITKKGLENSSANLLPIGSILMTSRATIGEALINTIEMATNQGFKSLICKFINNIFMYYFLKTIKTELVKKASGSTFLEISKKDVQNINLPLPPLPEQKKIADILTSVDDKIESLETKKKELQELKKGLMQVLLTGRVRVKVTA